MKFRAGALAFVLCLGVLPAAVAETSPRTVLDRLVAVVADDVVTLVELRRRAQPFLSQMLTTVSDAERPVAEAKLYREVLGGMIDERVIARFAKSQQLVVSDKEVDDAIGSVAAQYHMSVDEIFTQAAAQGMERALYRSEIERQLLRYKVLRSVLPSSLYEEHKGQPEAELTAAMERFFSTWLLAQRQALFIEVRL